MTIDQQQILETMRLAAKQLKQSDVEAARHMGEGIEAAARALEKRPEDIEKFVGVWTDLITVGVPS